ncbi:short chain dehydrogenase [Encephalitozoon cuniculi]|nr:short chain dehydrogenase [Encephalitozoon cuniculi]
MPAILLVLATVVAIYFMIGYSARHGISIRGRKILIIGGSSGLGLAFARILKEAGNDVTVTSRSMKKLEALQRRWGLKTQVLDVNAADVPEPTDFDYIFCCAGVSYPSYFIDQPLEVFEETANTNYLGTVAMLKHYAAVNKKPVKFIMIGSTLALLTFPGFSSYSPSKTALLSLFYTVRDEMGKIGVELYLYNTASILTPGFERENRAKPAYTRAVEGMVSPSSAEKRATAFLNGMKERRVVTSDVFTYLCQIRLECECFIDYILFPIAVAVVFASRTYVRWKFRTSERMGRMEGSKCPP